MSDSLLDKLKGLLQGAFLSHVPDHPSHGGNTGDSEWDPNQNDADDERDGEEQEETDGDQFDSR
ncbi:hypothetical protein [Halovenus sp. HT40]|uniref:hypothetical protein n=1 Tax=Halovenus sp. HT40 TaxID=3126691 RepID=UPI00300F58D5